MDLEEISAWLFQETVQKWEDPHRMIFKLSKCYKSASIAGHLKEHERTHMGERPFKCTKCDKSFSTSSYLKTHESIHSGEKPFKCTKSDMCFSRSSFKRNMRGSARERSLLNAFCMTRSSQYLATWRKMRGPTKERSHQSAQSVTKASQHTYSLLINYQEIV